MPEMHSVLPVEPPHEQHRLSRRSKAKLDDAEGTNTTKRRPALSNKNINTFRVPSAGISNQDSKSVATEPLETRTFEFVTITSEPSAVNRNETSKKVRTQAMRDYLRKQNKEAITGVPEVVSSVTLEEPSRYKGRFKLNTWSHKAKIKATNARKARSRDVEVEAGSQAMVLHGGDSSSSEGLDDQGWQPISPVRLPNPVFSGNGRMDPFQSLAIQLGPHSENLLVHYNTAYRMNSVAVNAEGDFFSYVKTDPALFHSILYLVALHYDLRYGQEDSPVCLYHGGEAFRIINERLADVNGVFSDQTIGAVAMLVNKENLNGRYELSKVHMQGLQMMVRMRGGIQSLRGVFRRIVTWCDFCYGSVWDCQPLFPRIPPNTPPNRTISLNNPTLNLLPKDLLKPSHLFGTSSPIISIFNTLRTLSTSLDPANSQNLDRIVASTQIYNLEYDLLLLNSLSSTEPDPNRCPFSWEAIPLKIASHLYLWLVIRELPPSSELLYTVVKRLKDSLEAQLPGWWYGDRERKAWLLWIFFMGTVASNGRTERVWFVRGLGGLCRELGVWSLKELRESLGRVVLQEFFFEWHLVAVWEDISLLWEVEGVVPVVDAGLELGLEHFEVPFSDEVLS